VVSLILDYLISSKNRFPGD